PPKLVRLGSTVFKYESYSRGQFVPQTFGSTVSSVTSTSLTYCCLASVFLWMMFTSSAVIPATSTAVTSATAIRAGQRFFGAVGSMPVPSSIPRAVADAAMTMDAEHRVLVGGAPVRQLRDHLRVTAETALLEDARVLRTDPDRLVEVLQGEGGAVVPAVLRLGQPLAHEGMRQGALHAGRHRMVRRVLPGGVLVPHDVAIHAGPRVAAHVREPLGVAKRERPQACDQPDGDRRHPRHTHAAAPGGPHGGAKIPANPD